MIIHYLKIAWRNLLKYKTQSVISILGLSIGFTAFSFTMSWIRYEMGYDSHNPHVDRIYCVERVDEKRIYNQTTYGLTDYLRRTFPEVEAACNAYSIQTVLPEEIVASEREKFRNDCRFSVYTDTSFFSVFYPEIKINYPYPLPDNAVIVTQSIAEKWDITPQKFGQKIESLNLTPIGITKDNNLQSNVAFRLIYIHHPVESDEQSLWRYTGGFTYIRLHKGASIEKIARAIDTLHITTENGEEIHSYRVYPLRKAHYLLPNDKANIKFEALKQFSVIAILVIICALLNYIMLFISRVKSRSREFALNKVNGASNKKILHLLIYEFLMVLLIAIFVGSVLTELLFPMFSHFSMIVASKSYFLVAVFWYSLIIITVSTLVTFALIYRFVRRSIRENVAPQTKSYHVLKINFSHIAIFTQLCIGVLLIFCTVIISNQYHLMDQRVGYNRNGLTVVWTSKENIPVSEIKKIAGVDDLLINSVGVLSRSGGRKNAREVEVTDKEGVEEEYLMDTKYVSSNFRSLLEIPLLSGRDIFPTEEKAYLINETGVRELGNNAIGRTIRGIPIIGVIPDLQVESPLIKIEPILYMLNNQENNRQMCSDIILRCENNSIKRKVLYWFLNEFPLINREKEDSSRDFFIEDIDASFKEFTKSERNLLMLIGIVTVVVILIAVFGIYSMVTLSCNQRRKEIAIRKVNGAKAGEVFLLFFREYFLVTILSCLVAFPAGVYIMQRWLEQYTRRVSMEWWIFSGIFMLIALIVFASIFFRVNFAARENPSEVVKRE